MEELLQGRQIVVTFDEQIVFDQLGRNENAIWSLLLASGYLKGGTGRISWPDPGTMVSFEYHKSGNGQYVFRHV